MKMLRKMAAAAMALMLAGALAVSAQAETEDADSQVASDDEKIARQEVVEDWMVPIYADELKEGVYDIDVASSSSMFPVESCQLTVKDGAMSAVLTMSGTGYLKVYPGTVEEAAAAPEEDGIPYVENADGKHTFEIPVEALDEGIDCAAFSKRKEKWYDRVLVFESTSLPAEAFKEIRMTTAEELALEDGIYQADVTLSGGSGRTTVDSPAEITVENGQITAQIIFSSPNYDYMLVDGEKYEPVNTEGNSTFLIPVAGFDYNMPVVADTVAMSVPHEIEYTLYLDSASLAGAE